MATILANLLDGKISLEDFVESRQSGENQDIQAKHGHHNLAELVPFLLNYLREKTSHHLTPRQTAALTPKKTPALQAKSNKPSVSLTPETPQHGTKGSSRGNLFSSQKTPTPSPATPLSQSRRERLQDRQSSPSSSPRVRRKSPKAQGSDGGKVSPLVVQQKLNIDDPEDFPPMGAQMTPDNKKVTPSRRITPTLIKSDGKKGKASASLSPSPFTTSPHAAMESHISPASLQEERNMLKLMKSKKKNKGDSPWGNRTSPSPHSGVRSPPLVLGDFIVSPGSRPHPSKYSSTTDAWQQGRTSVNSSVQSTPSPYKDFNENNPPCASTASDLKCQQSDGAYSRTAQPVHVEKDKVLRQDKIDVLAGLYSNCITGNLVPNVTAELYFVVQLLTTRGVPPELKEEQENSQKSETADPNVLDSIHNCVYFAVAVLCNIQRLILLLDKETLRLLGNNPRIAEFSPSLKETFLKQYKASAAMKVSELNFIKSPLGGVPFSVERDNRQNFPTDRAFHNFRKQRDVFYELVREWEDCHSKAGWNMEEYMGDRIRTLVNQRPELANYSHFARLFKSQLLQMCEEENSGTEVHSSSLLGSLQKSNPEKFQRLQERFVTPLSSVGPCPPPSFTNVQEFFKGFILSAASHSFNQHLKNLLIVTITELNDSEFPLADIKEGTETDGSIQNQELKQDFACCLKKIRILAKFLGFLLFQPYYGSEGTSQAVVTAALQIRNKIPTQFDILGYLKKAWCERRLVMTVPWAVEYLSMMDPLAPLLDYFSELLQWLLELYRQIACNLSWKDLNFSSFLLVSCLGWLFEIPVIPTSFFFKSLAELKHSDDDASTKDSSLQVNLDSSGLVDQAILYSCCPYLGEIRSVLVDAAAGMTARAGPVKKITPICADEPARISSSQKQLQLQLEENFFRIQPDFLKRLSDFTLERLSSNITSHIRGSIIPSLLDKGGQRIQAFLDSELSSSGNSDHAKEKCRPRVLKIIHSVTDDGVKRALEVVESCRTKSVTAFESLCPQEMNTKVIMTAANITSRLIKEKTTDWINTSLPNVMEEELFAQFNKIVNSILYLKLKEQREQIAPGSKEQNDPCPKTSESTSKTNPSYSVDSARTEENSSVLMKIKALQLVLSEQSKLLATQSSNGISLETADTFGAIESILSDEGEEQSYVKEMALVGQITVELAFIFVCRTAYGVQFIARNCTRSDCGILERLLQLWSRLKERRTPAPFERLLSSPHVHLIIATDNNHIVWEAVQQLCLTLIQNKLVSTSEVELWYINALSSVRDEESAMELGKACCHLVCAHHETRRVTGTGDGSHESSNCAEFSLLLSILSQRFSDNASMSSLLKKSIQSCPELVVMSDTFSAAKSTQSSKNTQN